MFLDQNENCGQNYHASALNKLPKNLGGDGGSNLILDQASSALSGQRRMGTRGANRGEKSEIKSLLKRQVMRCHENLDNLIVDFLANQRDPIFGCLMSKP